MIYREKCMYSSDKLFQHSWKGYVGVYFPSCKAMREMNTKITLQWAQKQIVIGVHIFILFLTWQNKSINDDKKDDLFTSSLCLTNWVFILLMTSHLIADEVTMTRQLWRYDVNSDI